MIQAECWYHLVQIEPECLYSVVQAHGTGTLPVTNLFHWNRGRSKETCPQFQNRSYTHAEGLSLFRDRLYTHDRACSRLKQVVQLLKWDYKAVEDCRWFKLPVIPCGSILGTVTAVGLEVISALVRDCPFWIHCGISLHSHWQGWFNQ